MPLISVPFGFAQRFPFPIEAVYAWATDYAPEDVELMGNRGRRRIERVCEDTLLLTDTFLREDGSTVKKRKLVRLYPGQFFWTNTHLTGPNRHSQFLYRLVAEGKDASRLEFSGQQVLSVDSATPKERKALSARLTREDREAWRHLAKAMASDLKPAASRGAKSA